MAPDTGRYPIELLSPARDLACGIAAINCGADAVYIGAPRFGARAAAGNPVTDIARLADYAHRYRARVYVTLNTILMDDEFDDALTMIGEVHDAGADALIIQDMGLLECDLPPMRLIASTQTDNRTPEKVRFLQECGFSRVILARELSLEAIREIRAATKVELEAFVHGALCVSWSGRCFLSHAIGGRSANRGECAQPCRNRYTLLDAGGRTLARDRHLLSLKDMNRSADLAEMIDAGITSFKIEGRLKDESYVKNVTAWYRLRLDEVLGDKRLIRSSRGRTALNFTPDPAKSFNRSFCDYFLHGRKEDIIAFDTPKFAGAAAGTVIAAGEDCIRATGDFVAGDGVSFYLDDGALAGGYVNRVAGDALYLSNRDSCGRARPGETLYRNFDKRFEDLLAGKYAERTIGIDAEARFEAEETGLIRVTVRYTDGESSATAQASGFPLAAKPDQAEERIRTALAKLGGTAFVVGSVTLAGPVPFLSAADINGLRRRCVGSLGTERERAYRRDGAVLRPTDHPYPEREIFYEGNVSNSRAQRFYERHGAVVRERAAEAGTSTTGRRLMTCKHCLKRCFGLCGTVTGDLTLVDTHGARYAVRSDCGECVMMLYDGEGPGE